MPVQAHLIGTYPPRRCGIASFTADLGRALAAHEPKICIDIVAIVRSGELANGSSEVRLVLRSDEPSAYVDLGETLNREGGVVLLQHEYGLFGGEAGQHLLLFLEALRLPLVTTLHTVLDRPNADQRLVMDRLLARSERVVVMSERGREILLATMQADAARIAVIPHGGPAREWASSARMKTELGLDGRRLLITFGLLSPDKGVADMVRALPAIVAAHPDALYLVVGVTHPDLRMREGERHRHDLADLAQRLGVAAHLRFEDAYVDADALERYVAAADICVLPYLKEAHVTSGTLVLASALGRPIVATPFWHAVDMLGEGAGVLTPFGSSEGLARSVCAMLAEPVAAEARGRRLFESARPTVWSEVAGRYAELLCQVASPAPRPTVPPHRLEDHISLEAVRRITDGCGVLQHSRFGIAAREHGYCLDDNARALILTYRTPCIDAGSIALRSVYAAFVEHAWSQHDGCVRNFMSYERTGMEARGSDDSFGRAFWAAAVAATGDEDDCRHSAWGWSLVERMLAHLEPIAWPRSNAFFIIGLAELLASRPDRTDLRMCLAVKAAGLSHALESTTMEGWRWFEPHLAYDNARLPQALIRAGEVLGERRWITAGLESLAWLSEMTTGPGGVFRPCGSEDFGLDHASDAIFDQQPLEAAAVIEACEAAMRVDPHPRWRREAERAYAWYLGANSFGAPLVAPGGLECYDGLTRRGLNRNRGAESIVSFQLAGCALERLRRLS